MAQDERIKANEWIVKKRCPICADIADKKIDPEGDQLFDDNAKTQPMFCPQCGHLDIRVFQEIGAVEIAAPLKEEILSHGIILPSLSA